MINNGITVIKLTPLITKKTECKKKQKEPKK